MICSRRAAICSVLALLPACLPLGLLLRSSQQAVIDVGQADRQLRVTLLPAVALTDGPITIDAAQRSVSNSREPADQNRKDMAAGARAVATDSETADGYLPVSRLTEWPRMDERASASMAALPLVEPDADEPAAGPRIFEGVLLINEHGDVDQVWLPEPGLSPAQRQRLQAHFLALRFFPGRLFGRPVRSMLRIEVRLD